NLLYNLIPRAIPIIKEDDINNDIPLYNTLSLKGKNKDKLKNKKSRTKKIRKKVTDLYWNVRKRKPTVLFNTPKK
ncbi:hypothetical protein OFB78_30340, partial [Escherichia coli]|nr:hypothetical protein [Escherichia coli]